jgi:hypothetical protein
MKEKLGNIQTNILKQIQVTLYELLKDPLQPYCIIGVEIHIHDGFIKRIKTKKETQFAIIQNDETGIEI